jgi:hypothetical protein
MLLGHLPTDSNICSLIYRAPEDLPTVLVRSPRHSHATRSRQHALSGEGSIDRTSSGMSENR